MNLNQLRQGRAARLLSRAVHRFQAVGAKLVRDDGETLCVELYRGRPSWTDSSTLGLRSAALVSWTCSAKTLLAMKQFVGGDGFLGGLQILYSGDVYLIDQAVPCVETGLGDGYTIQTMKAGPDAAV